jgi:hypothetical protein
MQKSYNTTDNSQEQTSEFVTINMKLIHWPHLDFKRTVQTTTTVRTITEVIKHHHGGPLITSIVICVHNFEQKNELRNANTTLKDCGIRGTSDRYNAPDIALYYNFKAEEDPILLC